MNALGNCPLRLLFLDFDGVLHDVSAASIEHVDGQMRVTGEHLFKHAGLLAELLGQHPDTRVVIASSWKGHFPLEDLKARLGPLGHYVVGTTLPALGLRPCANRFEECQAMAEHWRVEDWRLLDDQVDIVFGSAVPKPGQLPHVIFCDPVLGLTTPGALSQLTTWLQAVPGERAV